ncbi:polar growth protein [Vermiconidia calcicola]|uniref:Polar growth protein n=1 Tax=Vermiconidia calcicola TaxID=1690605 RepID=A0ACC3N2Y5_9PEZI|nr:polar growth protein [Vermiconidia calcicola]
MAGRSGANKEAQPGSILLAIHDFIARSDDELSLAKGDRIELIERDDEFGDGWFLGRHMNNARTGLFPEVYTTPAPKGTLAHVSPARRRSDGPPKTPHSSNNGTAASTPLQTRSTAPTTIDQRPASASTAQQSLVPPMAQMALRSSLPNTSPTNKPHAIGTDSPVMNETLSVIDEHMNDMNVPNVPMTNGTNRAGGSMSNPQSMARFSYIAGHETDDEEQQVHTEEEVMAWSPARVAEYLEDNGVEKAHCDVFVDQEISGEVLLAMEQSSIFLKEFDLGSVGRRLKTWHKVRALQDEARANAPAKVARSTSDYSGKGDDASSDATRNRASTMGSILPRALDTSRQSIAAPGRSNTSQALSPVTSFQQAPPPGALSPLQSMTSMSRPENTYRPSAQVIRQMQHHRHSSVESTTRASVDGGSRQSHRKQPSFDQQWQLGQLQTNGNGSAALHSHTLSADAPERQSSFYTTSPGDLDRGYFSSNELDSRPRNGKITKKPSSSAVSPTHSRQSSYATQRNRRNTQSGRLSFSAADPVSTPGSNHTAAQGIFGALNAVGNTFGNKRSVTEPRISVKASPAVQEPTSPIVTKLDHSNSYLDTAAANPSQREDAASKNSTSSPTNKMSFFGGSKPKITGLRTISDAITRTERQSASPVKECAPFSSRTGSTTPSTETQSIDLQKSEVQSRASNGSATNLVPPPARKQAKVKTKTKKATSAYTRGLEKKTPAEQMAACDYSGWMKKKSGSLMTTWKSRLFILKGRRLSYYYSDGDFEEKGLIDISFHRVLPAHNETITGLHATMTGAVGTPTSPKDSSTPTAAQEDLKQNPAAAGDEGIFIFKLVPPKTGLSKGVNFTKPTVHYFAVNSRQEGRLWMAALMKATIDRDDDGMVTTTYNQKTISLAKARARRERPPALREEDDIAERAELEGADGSSDKGLGIDGISEKNDTVAGAEKDKELQDSSSMAPSTPATESEAVTENSAAS